MRHSHICYINNWDEKTDVSVTRELYGKLSNFLKGWIDYIHSIEPELAKQYYETFNLIENVENGKRRKECEKFEQENGGIITIGLETIQPILKKK